MCIDMTMLVRIGMRMCIVMCMDMYIAIVYRRVAAGLPSVFTLCDWAIATWYEAMGGIGPQSESPDDYAETKCERVFLFSVRGVGWSARLGRANIKTAHVPWVFDGRVAN